MTKLAANLSWLFLDHAFLDRFQAAADCGFKAVEILLPYEATADAVAAKAAAAGVKIVLINAPAGDWSIGSRGFAGVAGADRTCAESVATGLTYASAIGCPKLHVMAGISAPGPVTNTVFVENLKRAGDAAAAVGIGVVIEPINPWDVPGYFLSRVDQAMALLDRIGHNNVRLQLDLYHAQRTEGGLADLITANAARLGHIQIAGVPGRNEPDVGEVDWAFLFGRLESVGYDGYIGCEYRPRGATRDGLGWAKTWVWEADMAVVAITGGAGFIGRRLARALAARGTIAGPDGAPLPITEIRLIDVVAATDLQDPRMRAIQIPALDPGPLAAAIDRSVVAVFHLAAIVSGQAEADFDLGWRVNVDGTATLLDLLRHLGHKPRLVFTSSVAAFGGAMPPDIGDTFHATPQTSYGAQKVIGELMVADYSRKGFLDGRSVRLPTIVVRPGKPNAAASSFFSGIIREPLAGVEAPLPVDAATTRHWVLSPDKVVSALIRAAELDGDTWGPRSALNLPGLALTVADMLSALERVAGQEVRSRVVYRHDPVIAKIVAGWPTGFDTARARALGFEHDPDFESIIRGYMAEYPPAAA